jgi:hypothetical protein
VSPEKEETEKLLGGKARYVDVAILARSIRRGIRPRCCSQAPMPKR